MYLYEATLFQEPGDNTYYVRFDAFPNCFADGASYAEAIESGAETLKLFIAEYLDEGRALPQEKFAHAAGCEYAVVAVDVDDEFVQRTKCMTVAEAAEELGVTAGRVSQLLSAGKLQAVQYGADRLVTVASVEERKAHPSRAGRPRKS